MDTNIGSDFDTARSLSNIDGYGDEGEGYDGDEQLKHLSRKYDISLKPSSRVDHPLDRDDFVALVHRYVPGMDDEEAMRYLLSTTGYPLVSLGTVRTELWYRWYENLDKGPFEAILARHFPSEDAAGRLQHLKLSGIQPDTADPDQLIGRRAETIRQQEERSAANRKNAEARNAEARRRFEENRPAREAHASERRVEEARKNLQRATERYERSLLHGAKA